MKYLLSLLVLLFIEGCGIILINENDYRSVSDLEKSLIRPFNQAIVTAKVNNGDSLFVYEFNNGNIKTVTRKFNYTWIHLWRPFCHADACQNIKYFADLADTYSSKGLVLLLVSETYDFNEIKNVMNHSVYNKPVFVLQSDYYGYKIRKNRIKFISELNPDLIASKQIWLDDFLFKDTTLIFAGNKLDKIKIDSLLGIVAQ